MVATDTATNTTTSDRIDDEGSIVITEWLPDAEHAAPYITGAAVFVENVRGIENLAQCLSQLDTFCIDDWPDGPEEWVELDSFDEDILEDLDTVFATADLQFGPWVMPTRETPTGLQFHLFTEDPAPPVGGPLALVMEGGEWGSFSDSAPIEAPTPMVLTQPPPLRTAFAASTSPLELRWNPADDGEVFLAVITGFDDRLYALEDDGAFDLDMSDYGLSDGWTFEVILGRWSRVLELDVNTSEVGVLVQANQRIYGEYREVAGTEIEPAETCTELALAEPLPSGVYWGLAQGREHQLDGTECTESQSEGADGMVLVEVPANHLLTLDYTLLSDDASLYVLDSCSPEGACLVGEDKKGNGGNETATWFNDSDLDQSVVVVLDAFKPTSKTVPETGGVFDLVVDTVPFVADILHDECVDALLSDAAPSASYFGTLGGYVDGMNPACVGEAATGGEGMVKVSVPAGATLDAIVVTPNSDAIAYVMYNCAIADSCIPGNGDDEQGETEAISYTNNTGADVFLYLVVDSAAGVGDYFLDIQIQ